MAKYAGACATRRHLSPARALTASQQEIHDEVQLIKEEHKTIKNDPILFDKAVDDIFDDILVSVMLGCAFEHHRNAKIGLLDAEVGIEEDSNMMIVDEQGLDIFGQPQLKKLPDCICPECHRSLTASRFAPHLEKCMGMGRNSSRLAQRRIANTNTASTGADDADDVDDADWTVGSDRNRRKKKERTAPKRPKATKLSQNSKSNLADGSGHATVASSDVSYEGMSIDEKKNLLSQICGVVSEHTKRLCTRSMRCPQHSDDQRRSVRSSLLNTESVQEASAGLAEVDVDTYEEGDGESMRDQLGRNWEHSCTNSPADSGSTGSSTQSKKKEKPPKKSRKNSKKAPFSQYGE